MKVLFNCLLGVCLAANAATPVNIESCAVTPTTGGLMGCPTASAVFVPITPTTLVRSAINSAQGWRAFNTLNATDQVYGADFVWHAVSSITIAMATPTPPVTTPPVVTPPATQDVTIISSDLPAQPVVFKGAPVPACFTVNAKQVCVP